MLDHGSSVLIKQVSYAGAKGPGPAVATTLAQMAGLHQLFAGLSPAEAAAAERAVTSAPRLPVRAVEPPPRGLTDRVTALVLSVLSYVLILIYGVRITIGVGEEKASRVVEILLTTPRPVQLLAGKVAGMGLLALVQVLPAAVVYLAIAAADGQLSPHRVAPGVVAIGVAWLLLGYALYSSAFAATGSLIARQADAYNAALPLYLPLVLAYVFTSSAVFSTSVSGLFWFLAFFPFTAPVAMPALFAIGAAAWWQLLVSAALIVATAIATMRLAGIVYGRAILRAGTRLRLRQVLRADFALHSPVCGGAR